MAEPQLPAALVEHKARSIFGQRRHRLSALLSGSGSPGRVGMEDFEVEIVPTSCELDLRRQMAAREERDGATLYLVDWHDGEALPRDLSARVAEGKVYRIGRDERLRQVFHANRLSYELTLSPLARLAIAGELRPFPKSPKLALDLRLAALTWLEQTVGEPFRAVSPREEDLLDACSRANPSSCQKHAERNSDWRAWLETVPDIIHESVSPLAGVAFRAWLAGQAEDLPAVLWTIESQEQARADHVVRKLVRSALLRHIPDWADVALRLSVTLDGSTVDAWDRRLRGNGERIPTHPPIGLEKIEQALDYPELFSASCRHTSGQRARESRLAGGLQQVLQLRGAADAHHWAEIHEAATALAEHRQVNPQSSDLLEMAQRLAAWVCSAPETSESLPPARHAVALAARFAREGGYVDWARRVLGRYRPGGDLGRALELLREAVEQKRDQEEQAFALGMKAWSAGGRSSNGCVPIERASKLLVGDFLRESSDSHPRRLLVLLMDGMSWGRCQELCEDLRDEWAPLRWRPAGAKQGSMPPMLAALPTITSVSRTAFFAGELPAAGREPATGRDPDRWANNPAIQNFQGPRGLPLFLKAAVEGDRQMPSAEVLDTIADAEQPLVAAVVNTLDDQLKGSPSLDFTAGANSIRPLRELLERAGRADRAILLVADHGHVVTDSPEKLPNRQEAGGARWRPHAESQPLDVREQVFDQGAWSPTPGEGVVLLAGERAQYGKHARHGEHGGLSLAEVVAPAVLLGRRELFEVTQDRDLDHAPPQTPTWWAEMRPETAPPATNSTPQPQPAARTTPSLFGDLGEVQIASAPPRPGRSSVVPAWVKQLGNSATFKGAVQLAPIPPKEIDRSIEQTLAICRLLVDSGGRASARSVAQATDVSLTRISGLMSRVKSIVNAEGEMCLREDSSTDTYVLDVPRFELVFGIQTRKQ